MKRITFESLGLDHFELLVNSDRLMESDEVDEKILQKFDTQLSKLGFELTVFENGSALCWFISGLPSPFQPVKELVEGLIAPVWQTAGLGTPGKIIGWRCKSCNHDGESANFEHDSQCKLKAVLDTVLSIDYEPEPIPQHTANVTAEGITLSDNGIIEPPDDDGTIRRRDVHGNCEEIRRPGDPGYEDWANQFNDDEP